MGAGPPVLEYKDVLCWKWRCVCMDYDPVAASAAAVVGSLWSTERRDIPGGSGKVCCQTLRLQDSFVSLLSGWVLCYSCLGQTPDLMLARLTGQGVGMVTDRWMQMDLHWLQGW